MKFEVDDIIVYCGSFPEFLSDKTFKIMKVTNNGYYQINSNSKYPEWLSEKYVESRYELDKIYLRKKKLNKLHEKN